MTDRYPDVPDSALDDGDWERRVQTESTVFRTPTSSIIGHTSLYDDAALRTALEQAGFGDLLDTDGMNSAKQMIDTGDSGGFWRFFFATALSFRPPLAPGVGPASMRPTVVSEARKSFEDDLRARGFENVERGPSQRVRTESRDRASLVKMTGSYPFDDAPTDGLDIEGWLAVWSTDGSFRIAGGAYPIRGLDGLLSGSGGQLDTDPNNYRDELLDLLRAVR